MPDLLSSIFDTTQTASFTFAQFLLCSAAALALGAVTALVFTRRTAHSRGFAMTLAILPLAVEVVIMLVNGNLGAGVAVAGAFSLVRFRSAQGSAKEICAIFIVMAIGLACGMGYVVMAALLTLIACVAAAVLEKLRFGEPKKPERELRLTVPEGMDYAGVFDGVIAKYAERAELTQVKTANMGSLFKLRYRITPRADMDEKRFIDELRCLNGNLEISLGIPEVKGEF